MDLLTQLKSTLESGTTADVYGLEKPIEAPVPAIVYTIISERQLISHSGDEKFRTARVQLTNIASSIAGIVSLVEAVRTTLNANTSNWEVSLPLETRIDNKEDNLYYSILEYYITYKA